MAVNELSSATHCISMENRRKLSLNGVEDVSGFDDNTVILKTSLGSLTIVGEQLHIGRIDLETGILELEGKVDELSYSDAATGQSVWQKLFG